MSDTHQWSVQIAEEIQEVIGTIQSGTWNTGPYEPGELVDLATIIVENTGNITGGIYGQPFFYPGQIGEQGGSKTLKHDIAPGGTWEYHPIVTIPTGVQPGSSLPVGVKIWGETETEPSWGQYGAATAEIPPYIIPGLTLLGLLGLTIYIGTRK